MEHYEMAELLSGKAKISLEEARTVLTENNWDMLDAMVALERRRGASGGTDNARAGAGGESGPGPGPSGNAAGEDPAFANTLAAVRQGVKRIFRLSVETGFSILRGDRTILSFPVLVLAVLLILCFWAVVPAMVIGLFFGIRYRFSGKGGAAAANRVMDWAGDLAESIRRRLIRGGGN